MTLTRTAVARFLTSLPADKRRRAVRQAAAWLVATGQSRRGGELAGEVARLQAEEGRLWVKLTSARPVDAESMEQVGKFLKQETGAGELEIDTVIDPSLIGGLLIETPVGELDTTISGKLSRFVQEASR